MKKKGNILVEEYLKRHSLVESNILSFNHFLANKMQYIIDEINASLNNEDVEIKIGKIKVGKPNIVEADGSSNILTPMIAKLRNLTYSAPVFVELSVKYGGQRDEADVEIGRIPIMVKSAACTTNGMDRKELKENYMDPLDPGGYFIINGN